MTKRQWQSAGEFEVKEFKYIFTEENITTT